MPRRRASRTTKSRCGSVLPTRSRGMNFLRGGCFEQRKPMSRLPDYGNWFMLCPVGRQLAASPTIPWVQELQLAVFEEHQPVLDSIEQPIAVSYSNLRKGERILSDLWVYLKIGY